MTKYISPLDATALEALGVSGFAYGYADRVRFGELDALNHVNNAVYLRWFENIRVSYLLDYGLTSYGAPGDPQLVVRRVTADYLAPVLQNESYVLAARTVLIKPSSFVMEYGLFVDTRHVASGEAVVVSLTADGSARQSHRPKAVQAMVERDGARTEGF